MTERAFYLSGAAVLGLALCLHLFFFDRGFYSIGWDESGRSLDAHAWATRGISSKVWLPFYRICVGLGLRLHPDLFLTPRVISLLFGLGSIVAVAWLAHELFGHRKTTLLTLALGAFFSQRIALSLAPLSDIMLTLLILATMALLVRWLRTHSRTSLFSCALLGALATTIRYEAWIFAATLLCVVAGGHLLGSWRVASTDLVLFAAILFGFVTWWSVGILPTTNPITVIVDDSRQHSAWQILRKNPLVELVIRNGLTLNLIGAVSIFQLARRGPRLYMIVIATFFVPLAIASLILLLIWSAQTGPSWRMIGVWSMLLLPFTAYLLAGGLCPAAARSTKNALAGATMLVLAAFVYDVFRIERESSWAFPKSDRRAGEYLDDVISAAPDTRILIESSSFAFLNLQVASQHPDAFVLSAVPEEESVPILSPGGSVRDALAGRKIDLLIFRTDQYRNLLDQSPGVAKLEQFGAWSIYRLTN